MLGQLEYEEVVFGVRYGRISLESGESVSIWEVNGMDRFRGILVKLLKEC